MHLRDPFLLHFKGSNFSAIAAKMKRG